MVNFIFELSHEMTSVTSSQYNEIRGGIVTNALNQINA